MELTTEMKAKIAESLLYDRMAKAYNTIAGDAGGFKKVLKELGYSDDEIEVRLTRVNQNAVSTIQKVTQMTNSTGEGGEST